MATSESAKKFWSNPDKRKQVSETMKRLYAAGGLKQLFRLGPKNGKWKESTIYSNIHHWLTRHYGKPTHCESKKCNGSSISFQWALRAGKKYERKRANYQWLCASCHHKYDKKHKPGSVAGYRLKADNSRR